MNRILGLILIVASLSLGFIAFMQPAAPVSAACQGAECVDQKINIVKFKTGRTTTVQSFAKRLTNTLLYIVGALSVIMIVVGGIRYATSSGDATNATKAKNTILYAVAGLVIALIAFAIVNFVLKSF